MTPEQLRKAADDVEFDQYKNRQKTSDPRAKHLGTGWDVRVREKAAARALREAADTIISLRSMLYHEEIR